jgi:putative endonuclease
MYFAPPGASTRNPRARCRCEGEWQKSWVLCLCHPRRGGEWNEPLRAGDHLNFFMLCMYYVYVMTNQPRGTLYTGVTNDLVGRVWQHRNDVIDGFTRRYGLHLLVYFESTEDVREAIRREKRLKRWNREWKIAMIEKSNPEWKDLYETITEDGCPLKAGMTPGWDDGILSEVSAKLGQEHRSSDPQKRRL